MKSIFATVCLLYSGLLYSQPSVDQYETTKNDMGDVYYTSLDADLYVPYHEDDIDEYAICHSQISKTKFARHLKLSDKTYEKNWLRVKVKFKDKVYFIDQNRVVTDYSNHYEFIGESQFFDEIRDSIIGLRNIDTCSAL